MIASEKSFNSVPPVVLIEFPVSQFLSGLPKACAGSQRVGEGEVKNHSRLV
jgi:hypothetical protein